MSPTPTQLVDRAQDRAVTRRPGFRSRERFNFGGHRRRGGEPFGALVVFNEDDVEHGVGIPMHPHAGVEVISLMLAGRMHHLDSLGNDLIVGPDQVKVMHTGDGLHHGGTCLDGTRFLQIWLAADPTADSSPRVDVVTAEPSGRRDRWQTVAAPTPGAQVVGLRQAAWLFRGAFTAQREVRLPRPEDDGGSFVYLASGSARFDGVTLQPGDTLSLLGRGARRLVALTDLEVVVITQPTLEWRP